MPPTVFPLTPWFSVRFQENGIKNLISTGEGGRERRRNKVATARRVISFPLKVISSANLTTLYDFYVARKGSYEAFNITVDGTLYLVRFAKDGLTWEWFVNNWKRSNIELQEVTA